MEEIGWEIHTYKIPFKSMDSYRDNYTVHTMEYNLLNSISWVWIKVWKPMIINAVIQRSIKIKATNKSYFFPGPFVQKEYI